MHERLRLADRQGLLVGRHLSEVQNHACQVLIYLEDIKEFRNEAQAFKLAVAARPEFDVEKMFPQYFPAKVVDDEDQAAPGEAVDYNYEAVEWQGPSDTDQETLNRMLSMLAQAGGAVSGSTTFGDGGGKWV